MAADRDLIEAVRRQLHDLADPVRAPRMQAYMKSAMPYLGVAVPVVRSVIHAEARRRPPATANDLVDTAAVLWREAHYREERYAATALTGAPVARRLQTLELLPLYQEMITSGAWWDHVDEVAHRVGVLLAADSRRMRPVIGAWARDQNLWLRRAAIICQLDLRQHTQLGLLTEAILANIDDREFFIRKAIGWALRQYARTDPDWVRGFVAEHADRLSTLSRREALKHIPA